MLGWDMGGGGGEINHSFRDCGMEDCDSLFLAKISSKSEEPMRGNTDCIVIIACQSFCTITRNLIDVFEKEFKTFCRLSAVW